MGDGNGCRHVHYSAVRDGDVFEGQCTDCGARWLEPVGGGRRIPIRESGGVAGRAGYSRGNVITKGRWSMQIGAINRRAQQRYATFVSAMDLVRETLDEANKLVAKMPKQPESPGWTVSTREELKGLRRSAIGELERLRKKSKTYEAELVSREWRL
jgi:hypothetical protein